MGFLVAGEPLSWEESKAKLEYVRIHGIAQFIALYNIVKETAVEDDLFWGDEVEYAILETEGEDGAPDRTIKLALVGSEAMAQLNALETSMHNPSQNGCSWHQEFGSWMLEGTPALPYSGYARDLVEVEQNMRRRRARILALLPPNRLAPTTTNFPLLGVLDTPRAPTDDAAVANGAAADQGDAPAGGESGGRSGVGGACLTVPLTWPGGPSSESAQVSDACINPHPRFGTLAANIRKRRGSKVAVRMPLFKDAHTPEFATHDLDCPEVEARAGAGARAAPEQDGGGGGESVRGEPLPFHLEAWGDKWPMVTGDCMAFGMGSCCLQVTFQSRDVHESRFMFDQLAGLSPIMLALSAASPCFNGRLLDTDARWTSISQSVDDRTPQERGLGAEPAGTKEGGMAGGGVRRLSKSRYDSVSCFLSLDTPEAYNDIPCEVDEAARASLLEAGVDPVLARHVAHLFTRDPLVMYQGSIEEIPDDGSRTDHWESLQSTNWQTMRWKPPPAMPASASDAQDPASRDYAHIGWRTEFRSMEVQLTDFENAAYTVFIVLLTRVLLVFDLDLLLPLSKIDANMQRAHARAPVKTQKFWFRKDVTPGACRAPCPQERAACEEASRLKRAQAEAERLAALESGVPVAAGSAGARAEPSEELFEEMSMGEVLGGKGDYFPGLVPLCYAYLDHIKCDRETFKRVDMYLTFLLERGAGKVGTCADWIRNFVASHPEYRGDSVLSPAVVHDLMKACDEVGRGASQPPSLLGSAAGKLEAVQPEDAYGTTLAREKLGAYCRSHLIRKLTQDRVAWKPRSPALGPISGPVGAFDLTNPGDI